jgi:hypothetical protein
MPGHPGESGVSGGRAEGGEFEMVGRRGGS